MTKPEWFKGEQGEIADRLQHLPQADGGALAAAGGSAPDQDVPPSDGGASVPGGSTSPAATAAHAPPSPHVYLSTACFHGECEHCQCRTNIDGGPKEPGQCKFCTARCIHDCHTAPTTEPAAPVRPLARHRESVFETLLAHQERSYNEDGEIECTCGEAVVYGHDEFAAHQTDEVLATAVDLDSEATVEHVAQALYRHRWPTVSGGWRGTRQVDRDNYRDWARTALAALRDIAGGDER